MPLPNLPISPIRHVLLASLLILSGCAERHAPAGSALASGAKEFRSAAHATVKLLSLDVQSDTVGPDEPLRAWARVANVGNAPAKVIPVQLRATASGPSAVVDAPLDQRVAFDVEAGDERKLEMTSPPDWRRQVGIRPGRYLLYAVISGETSVDQDQGIDTTEIRRSIVFR